MTDEELHVDYLADMLADRLEKWVTVSDMDGVISRVTLPYVITDAEPTWEYETFEEYCQRKRGEQ